MIKKTPQSIAILRLSALGDICMTVPLVLRLQETFPDADIYWIISENMSELVEGLEGVQLIKIKKPKSFVDFFQLREQLKSYQFDVLLAIQASLRSNLICPFIRAKVKYGYGKLHRRDLQRLFINRTVTAKREHLVDSFLRFAEALGADREKPPRWRLPISAADFAWAKAQMSEEGGCYLGICPTASKVERNWPVDCYVETIKTLQKRWQFTPVLIGGPEKISIDIAAEIQKNLDFDCVNLVGKSRLKQLAAVLSACDVLIAPDSGPVHIANAMGTPVVGLYAVAPPEKTGPYNSLTWVVNQFPEAVRRFLKKDPSQVSWRQRVHTKEAMELIQVDEVVTKCDALFRARSLGVAKFHNDQ